MRSLSTMAQDVPAEVGLSAGGTPLAGRAAYPPASLPILSALAPPKGDGAGRRRNQLILAGGFAYRSFQKGAPPTPDLAIEEARRVRQTLEGDTTPYAREP